MEIHCSVFDNPWRFVGSLLFHGMGNAMTKDWLMMASIGAGIVAAVLAIIAANVPIRNEIDSFMNDIYRQGWWAACAAGVAAVGVLLQAAHYFLSR